MPNRLRTLANVARLSLCGVSLLAVGTAWVWQRRPELLAQTETWLDRKLNGPFHRRYDEAAAERDPQRAEAMMLALAADLEHVHRQDHLADKRLMVWRWLAQAAEQRGDIAAANEWIEQCAKFDDHDLHTLVDHAEALLRQPEQRGRGLELLDGLARRFPGHPMVVPPLVHGMAELGRVREAWELLRQADQAPRSNLWLVLWDPGNGFDLSVRRADLIQVLDGDRLRLRFSIDETIQGLELRPPAFSSMLLAEPVIRTTIDGKPVTLDLASLSTDRLEFNEARRIGGRLQTDGGSGPQMRIKLGFQVPANVPIEFSARMLPLPRAALADTLRSPAFLKLQEQLTGPGDAASLADLRRMRALSTADDTFELFWSAGGQPTSGDRRYQAPVEVMPTADGVQFTASFATAMTADMLRIDLPAGPGLGVHLQRLELRRDGKVVPIDPATVPLLTTNSVERRGDVFVVTGDDPYFSFAVPAGAIEAVQLAGDFR